MNTISERKSLLDMYYKSKCRDDAKEIVWKHTKDMVWKQKIFNNSLYIKCIKDVTKDINSTTIYKCKTLRTYCGPISFEKNSIPTSSTVHILLHKSKSSTCPMFLSKRCGKAFQLFAFCLLFTDSIIYNSWCYLCFINKIFYDWNFSAFLWALNAPSGEIYLWVYTFNLKK